MDSPLGSVWGLLRPHLAPRRTAFVLVFVFGMLTAAAQASSLGLFAGVWRLIFESEDVSCAHCDEALPGHACVLAESAEGGAATFLELPRHDECTSCGRPLAQHLCDRLPGRAPEPVLPERANALDSGLDRLEAYARTAGPFEDWRLSMLLWLSLIAFALAVIAAVTQWGYTLVSRRIAFQMIVDLRVRVARHLMGLSMHYHGRRSFGDLLSRISSDVTQTLTAVNLGMRQLLLEPINALWTFVFMLIAAPVVTLGVALTLPIALLPVMRLTRKVKRGSRRSQSSLGASVQSLTQMFAGMRTVKSFGGEERELARYRELNQGYLKSSMKMVRALALSHSWTAFYSIAGIGVLVLVIGTIELVWQPFANGGVMLAWFVMVARFNNHVKDTAKAYAKFGEAAGAAERIHALLAEEVDVIEAERPETLDGLGRGLRFEGVTFRYADGDAAAIQGLDLEIVPGETLALVGPSGAGKSTLVDLVARFIDPSEGRVTIDGHDLRTLSIASWNAHYAMVSQVPFLFHSSIAENIGYGKEGASREEIEEAARAAGIHDFVSVLPEGYDTDVADMGTRLSGGQRQRITIARALLKGAPLLLLDEATSALDTESEREVQDALERLMKDRTVIVIAHRLSTVRNADRIAVLEEGRLVELGTHDELLELGGTYARLSSLQNFDTPAPIPSPS